MGPSEKGKQGPGGTGGGGAGASKFRNESRMQALLEAFRKGDRVEMEAIVASRQENAKLHKKLRAKDAAWEELKEEVVYKVEALGETVVAKFFPEEDGFPFHEVCGNVVGTSLLGQGGGGPFYVRTHDIGKSVERDGQWVVVMEYLEADAEAIDLDEPANLYNLLYQVAYGVEQLRRSANLQHFDLRYDNIMVKLLPEPKDLFKNGILSSFVVKIGDFGQCEFDFPPRPAADKTGSTSSTSTDAAAAAAPSAAAGAAIAPPPPPLQPERPENASVPREEEYRRKWGIYPRTYTGYDFQYFLGTLTPVLDSLHGLAYYHVYTMALQFLQPCAFTTAQDRPTEITSRMPLEIMRYLKEEVAPTL